MKLAQLLFLCGVLNHVAASPLTAFDFNLDSRAAINEGQLTNFKFFAQYAAASYCPNNNNSPNTPVTCASSACPLVEGAGATTVAEWTATLTTGQQGFLAIDKKNSQIVLSFRGSNSIRNWITNFDFGLTSFPVTGCSNCQVHSGFYNAFKESQPKFLPALVAARKAYPSFNFIVTGHSLGGAVASIAGASLRTTGYPCDIYTYGSPRIGDDALATFISGQAGVTARITHVDDPVPRLPPLLFGFRHTTPEYWLATGTSSTNNYGVGDVKVCQGVATTGCNAGVPFEIDIPAHLNYLGPISACSSGFGLKERDTLDARGSTVNLSEAELRALMQADLEYGKGLAANAAA